MAESPLLTPLRTLPAVGRRRSELLAKMGLVTVEDVLWAIPRDVLDLTKVVTPSQLVADTVQTVKGRVADLDSRKLTGGKLLSSVLFDCGEGFVRGVWFNQEWVLRRMRPGDIALVSGKCTRRAGKWEFSHPRLQWLEEDSGDAVGGVLPKYRLTEGLAMHEMRRIARIIAEDYAHLVPDPLPPEFRDSLKLPALNIALRQLHLPATIEEFKAGNERLIFDDLLEFQIGVALRRRMWHKASVAPVIPVPTNVDLRIRKLFPFDFTAGQNRAVHEIALDLAKPHAMHRLLQADVGAGKTVVAVYAMLAAVAAGRQAVLMAPTELLARQHWGTIDHLLKFSRVRRGFLAGTLSPNERASVRQEITTGAMQLVVGTHAVIQEGVTFRKLGVAVIDEQHRFGVMQRAKFAAGGSTPHTLVMTATPIPRSLCLTQFGDLDTTLMTDLPPGRQPVVTSRVPPGKTRTKMWDFVRGKLTSGRQAYVVCPRIAADATRDDEPLSPREHQEGGPRAEDGKVETRAVEAVYRELVDGDLRGFTVAKLHGGLSNDEKVHVMRRFREGATQVLIATTMVEVGVDVPNATMMIIEQAERFGLSQLHQLRGRVGRGEFQGYCFLFSETDDPDAVARLTALEAKASGFDVAEADFELRGPGDILGTRQSGLLPLRFADLVRDKAQLADTRAAAFELVQSGQIDSPPFAPLKIRVMERFGKLFDIAGGG